MRSKATELGGIKSLVKVVGVLCLGCLGLMSCSKKSTNDSGSQPPPAGGPELVWSRGSDAVPSCCNSWDISGIKLDGTGFRRLTTTGAEGYPLWSPNGSRILFTESSGAPTTTLWVMDADGANKRQVIDSVVERGHAWSPNGARIAVLRQGAGAATALFVVDSNGANRHFIADSVTSAGWVESGSEVICCINGDSPSPRLEKVSADGSVRDTIFTTSAPIAAVLGPVPGSGEILFVHADSLARMKPDGTDYRAYFPLDYERFDSGHDDIGLNGAATMIAFEVNKQVYVANTDGTGLRAVGGVQSGVSELDLSGDGTWIAFRNSSNSDADIILQKADGSTQRNLTNTPTEKDKAPQFRP